MDLVAAAILAAAVSGVASEAVVLAEVNRLAATVQVSKVIRFEEVS